MFLFKKITEIEKNKASFSFTSFLAENKNILYLVALKNKNVKDFLGGTFGQNDALSLDN